MSGFIHLRSVNFTRQRTQLKAERVQSGMGDIFVPNAKRIVLKLGITQQEISHLLKYLEANKLLAKHKLRFCLRH